MRQESKCGIYQNTNGDWCVNWYESNDPRKFKQVVCKTKEEAVLEAKNLGFTSAITNPGDARGNGRVEITL